MYYNTSISDINVLMPDMIESQSNIRYLKKKPCTCVDFLNDTQ